MKRITAALVLFMGLAAFEIGCGVDREQGILMAAGSYGDVAVVLSDPALRPAVDRFLTQFNDEFTFVINTEPRFAIDVFGPEKLGIAKGYKNIVMILRIGDGGSVQKQIQRMLKPETYERMADSGGGLAQLDDPFATYQFALVVASRDRNSLISILRGNAERLRTIIEQKNRWRLQRRFRQDGLAGDLTSDYWQRFGIFIEIPREFRENQREPDGFPGLELMRNDPSRGISISWTASDDPVAALRDREFLLAVRTRMGEVLHNNELAPQTLAWTAGQLGRNDCVKLEGAWTSTVFAGGGPFWSFFLADPAGKRVICLDLLVFAPGEDKMNIFRQLEATAATFSFQRPHP